MIAGDAKIDERVGPMITVGIEKKSSWLSERKLQQEIQCRLKAAVEVETDDCSIFSFILLPITKKTREWVISVFREFW